MTDLFDYRQCHTCAHVVYDIEVRMYRCMKSGAWIWHNPHAPTGCKEWKDEREKQCMKEIRKEIRFCGSCRYFQNEDINGDGWCVIKDSACRCDEECSTGFDDWEIDD